MDPILSWILHHPRAQRQGAALRSNYEALYGAVTDAEWRSGVNRSYRQERAASEIATRPHTWRVGLATQGHVASQGGLAVRVLIEATDVSGNYWSQSVTIMTHGRATLASFWEQVAAVAQDAAVTYGLSNVHVGVLPDIQPF